MLNPNLKSVFSVSSSFWVIEFYSYLGYDMLGWLVRLGWTTFPHYDRKKLISDLNSALKNDTT